MLKMRVIIILFVLIFISCSRSYQKGGSFSPYVELKLIRGSFHKEEPKSKTPMPMSPINGLLIAKYIHQKFWHSIIVEESDPTSIYKYIGRRGVLIYKGAVSYEPLREEGLRNLILKLRKEIRENREFREELEDSLDTLFKKSEVIPYENIENLQLKKRLIPGGYLVITPLYLPNFKKKYQMIIETLRSYIVKEDEEWKVVMIGY